MLPITVIFLLLLYVNKGSNRVKHSLLNAFLLEWIVLLLFYYFYGNEFTELTLTTEIYISLFIFQFTLVYFLFERYFNFNYVFSLRVKISTSIFYLVCLFISILSLFIGLKQLAVYGFNLSAFRSGIFSGSVSSFGLGFSLPLSFCALYLSINERKTVLAIVFSFLSLAISIVSTSKIFLIIFIVYLVISKNVVNFKKSMTILIGGCLFFLISSVLLDKFSSSTNDGIFIAFVDTLKVYFLSGISAFNLLIDGAVEIPHNTLLLPLRDILSGYVTIPETDVLPWVSSGKWDTNVYTGFAPWYEFFGFLFPSILGCLLGFYYAFWFSFKSSFFARFYQIYLYFPLLILFFQEHFLLSWKMHMSYIFCSSVLLFIDAEVQE